MDEDRIVDIVIIGAILTVIILKIVGVITISWLWLFSPIWILFGLGLILAVFMTIICILSEYIDRRR